MKFLKFDLLADFKCAGSACPMLTKERLCEVYQRLGREAMCSACAQYPNCFRAYGDIGVVSLFISCPEVSRLLLEKTGVMEFDFGENTEISCNGGDIDWSCFNILLSSLTEGVDILQNREISLTVRLRLLVLFISMLQNQLDGGKDSTPILEAFSKSENYKEYRKLLEQIPDNHRAKLNAFDKFRLLSEFHDMEQPFSHLLKGNSSTISDVCAAFDGLADLKYEIQYENYCVYFFATHYLEAIKDKRPLKQVANLIYLLNIMRCIAAFYFVQENGEISLEKQIDIFSSVARSFEHSDFMLGMLHDLYAIVEEEDVDFLISIV